MKRFKPIYKNEYDKLLDKNFNDVISIKVSSEKSKKDKKNSYVFISNIISNYKSDYSTFSNRTKNKEERFENELICKE